MGLAGGTGALRVWGDFMLALPNEPLPESPPEGVVLGSACGRSGIPYIAGSGGGAGACGDSGDSRKPASGQGASAARVAEEESRPTGVSPPPRGPQAPDEA